MCPNRTAAATTPRTRGTVVALLGFRIQGQIVVNHLLGANVSVSDLEASGVPFALAVVLPGQGSSFTADLAQMSEPLRIVLIGGALVLLGYACAGAIVIAGSLMRHGMGGRRPDRHRVSLAGKKRLGEDLYLPRL